MKIERLDGTSNGDHANSVNYRDLSTSEAESMAWLTARIEEGRRRGMYSVLCTVTPDMAKALLQYNDGNRKLKAPVVRRYAEDMKNGRWDGRNGENIKIAHDGGLNDGQHRLHGILLSGAPQEMMLVFGVDPAGRFTVDQGTVRTSGDFLAMHGVKYSTSAATVATLLISLERTGEPRQATAGHFTGATKSEIVERAQNDKMIEESCARIPIKKAKEYGSPSKVITAYYLLWKYQGREQAEEFYTAFVDQLLSSKDDPCYYAVQTIKSKEWRRGKTPNDIIYLMLRAMRLRRDGYLLQGSIPVRPHGKKGSIWSQLQ